MNQNFPDMSDVISDYAEMVTFNRPVTAGRYIEGEWVSQGRRDVEIPAAVMPLTDRARQLLDEGVRETAQYVVYTTRKLCFGDRGLSDTDILVYDGGRYRLTAIKPWGTFEKAIAITELQGG